MARTDTREMRYVASAPESRRPCSCHACIGLPSKTFREDHSSHHGCARQSLDLDRFQSEQSPPPDPFPTRSSSISLEESLLNNQLWHWNLNQVSTSRPRFPGETNPCQTHWIEGCGNLSPLPTWKKSTEPFAPMQRPSMETEGLGSGHPRPQTSTEPGPRVRLAQGPVPEWGIAASGTPALSTILHGLRMGPGVSPI
jgi:hypothetical protein